MQVVKVRLQKVLAQAGLGSRRSCEELIKQGRVTVNRVPAVIGTSVDPATDVVRLDGESVRLERKMYLMLYKPRDYVVSMADEWGRRTVMNLVPRDVRVFPVGRLDKDSEGLLILTNDGQVANCLTHPRFEVEKEYMVTVNRDFEDKDIAWLRKGVLIDGKRVDVRKIDVLDRKRIALVIHEGRKHIVKLLFQRLGFRVARLVRTRVGPLILRGISSGHYRHLTSEELQKVLRLCRQT